VVDGHGSDWRAYLFSRCEHIANEQSSALPTRQAVLKILAGRPKCNGDAQRARILKGSLGVGSFDNVEGDGPDDPEDGGEEIEAVA
jgi:hypothetical protein